MPKDKQTEVEGVEKEPGAPEERVEAKSVDELPEWARRELADARGDAEKYRANLREVEARMSGMKSLEEFEAAVAELSQRNEMIESELQFAKDRDAVRAAFPQLPADAFDFIPRGDVESMKASAEKLVGLIGAVGGDPLPRRGGGVEPGEPADPPFDPVEFVKSIPRR